MNERVYGTLLGRLCAIQPAHEHGAVVRRNRWLPTLGGWCAGMRGRAAAVTIGRTIVVHPDAPVTDRLLRHELAHVRQWSEAPFSFPLRYVWSHIRYGYRNNPYEVEARRAEQHAPPQP